MSAHTRSQRLAQAAYSRITPEKAAGEYASFAKKFPALIHTCGLAQAVAFALAKKQGVYAEDLAAVLQASGHVEVTTADALAACARDQQLSGYLRLSLDALQAAGWLKRYAEAMGKEDE